MKKSPVNWLSIIKEKQIKEKKLYNAQLCMAGNCKTKL
jgi:hypothetical protein